ncbi:MAG: DUF3857 domain-containing protein [Caulobacterales bacterium]|nr:DUF3857 domain-containing protein [Caulobacterales bacterium]
MLRFALGVVVGVWAGLAVSGAAWAADKLAVAPPADWVKPGPELTAVGPPPATGPAVRVVRLDEQLRFGPTGDAVYLERAAQVRTSLGLMSMGTISISWDPSRDSVTVHRVRIIRDGKPIDVLARQSFSVIRRETNLTEVVDGRLTATLQPEDLRVGDVLDVAYTMTHLDPILAGRTDMAFALGGFSQLDALSLRASWPSAQPVAWRVGDDLQRPKVTRHGDTTELTLDLKDLPEPKVPFGAPRRYWPSRDLEFSGFKSWAEVAATVAPLFDKAATLAPDSPLRAEVEKIRAATPDPKARAALALKLVQDQVRYLGLLLTDGGYTPVAADKTWARRFGECKAKSVLLVALLRELGIKAEPALVNAYGGERLDQGLPRMGAFNHAIVRAEIGGKVYWLDGTRAGDGGLDAIDIPPFGWALPLRAEGAQLIPLVRTPREKPDSEIAVSVDATGGLEAAAPAKGEMVMRGEAGLWPGLIAANLPTTQRDEMLKAMWWRFPWLEVKSVSASRDPETGESRLKMEGVAKLRWYGAGGGSVLFLPEASVGAPSNFKRDPPGPHDDAPYAVPFPSSTTLKLAVKLPLKGAGFKVTGPDVDKQVAGRAFFRHTGLDGDTLTVETRVRALAPEFPAVEAKAAAEALAEMGSARVFLTAPATYVATAGDVAAWEAQEPKTALDYAMRGSKFGQARRHAQAMADFDKAIALDPTLSGAYSARGLVKLGQNDVAGAKADYDKALALEPRNAQAYAGLGALAMREDRPLDAVDAFTHAAYLAPSNYAALGARAEAYRQLADFDHALADSDEVLRLDPKNLPIRFLRLQVYAARRDYDRALAEVDVAAGLAPSDPMPAIYRGALLVKMGRRDEAEKSFAAAIAQRPTAMVFLTRAANRPKTDTAARLADVAAAEKLDPKEPEIVATRARVLMDAGRYPEAIQVLSGVLKTDPTWRGALSQRAMAYAKAGQSDLALKDFAALRDKAAGSPGALNALCWNQATVGLALDAALADCTAALKVAPTSPHILDSEGFVLLRLGRLKESIEAYDAAIRQQPRLAPSLYGRGLAKLRLGQSADGEADLAAAHAASPEVEEEFTGYGVTRPAK